MKGKIKKLVYDRGFGFISTEEGEEVFFHRYDLEGVDLNALREGTGVEFNLRQTPKGAQAFNIRCDPPPQFDAGAAMVPVATLQIYVQPYVEQADRLRQERDAALARIAELEREVGHLEGRLKAREDKNWLARLFGR